MPATEAARRGARYWDPLATLGYVAARTTQIRLATMTLVLGYHHPLAIVKRYGTLDHVSNGRVILGVGVGTLKEEFDLLGAPFDDRGDRGRRRLAGTAGRAAEQRARLCRQVLLVRRPHRRPMRPPAAHADLDRWPNPAIVAACAHARRWLVPVQRADRHRWRVAAGARAPPGFEVVLPADQPLDPVKEPEATRETLATMAAAGTTTVSARFVHHSLEHYLEQIHALAELNDKTAG